MHSAGENHINDLESLDLFNARKEAIDSQVHFDSVYDLRDNYKDVLIMPGIAAPSEPFRAQRYGGKRTASHCKKYQSINLTLWTV